MNLDDLYDKNMANINNLVMDSHEPLAVAAVLVTQGLSLYRTMLSEDEYQAMVDNIISRRDDVKIFEEQVLQ